MSSLGNRNAMIQVFMLGAPRVEVDGATLRIPRTQVQALLYRLAIRPAPVDRDHLCMLFWPETTDLVAHTNLRRLISLLRKALWEENWLVCHDNGVTIDPQIVWSDAHAFEQLSAAARRLADPRAVERALSHYGGPFLSAFAPPGYEFDAWCAHERDALQGLYLSDLLWLMEHFAAAHELPIAINYAQRYLATDLLDETVHGRLIELYLAGGNRTAALRQYELCKAVLHRELGVSPLPETTALRDDARRTNFAVPSTPQINPGATPPLHERWNLPLLGRDRELAKLCAAFKNAQAGLPAVVLISGEPGIGKTRLMRSFCSSVAYRARVLAVEACQQTVDLPYFTVVQALRPALSEVRLDELVDPIWLSETARLLPELASTYPAVTCALPDLNDETRIRLFEALVRVVKGLIERHGPVVLAIDNLHQADKVTLEWLAYLCHGMKAEKLMIIGCYRPLPASASSGFSKFLTGLACQRSLIDLNLDGLDDPAVKAIVGRIGALLPVSQSSAAVDQLALQLRRLSNGNPLFVLEILDHIAQGGIAPADLLDGTAIPATARLRAVLGDQLKQLSPINRQVLEAAAVLGPQFGLDVLRQTSGCSEDEIFASVDQLCDLRLLVTGIDGYRFHHELVRQTVADETGRARQEMLHRRAERALKRLPSAKNAIRGHRYNHGPQWSEGDTAKMPAIRHDHRFVDDLWTPL